VRTYDERVAGVVWEEDRGRVGRDQISGGLHGVSQTVLEVERRQHFVVGIV